MKKYALVKDNIVIDVVNWTDQDAYTYSSQYQCAIDIDDTIPQPEIGWVLVGNALVSINGNPTQEEIEVEISKKKREFGYELTQRMSDKISARNIILEKTSIQIVQFLQNVINVKLLLESGALETGKQAISSLIAGYPEYTDICTEAQAEITAFQAKYNL